jgi:23S rRNA (adenine2030-N6)-methyltransferase
MLSYRHAYHAGNFADVLKHCVFIHALEYMTQKDKPLRIIDTHAGAGGYKLGAGQALKNREFDTGIGKLWDQAAATMPADIAKYVEQVKAFNPGSLLSHYPGSPMLAQQLMRAIDHLYLHELHSTDARLLEEACAQNKHIKVIEEDGFAGLQALLPPLEKRALILIDPSYEIKSDYQHLVKQVIQAHKRCATACFAIWYPVVSRARIDELERAFKKSGIANIQLFELAIAPDSYELGMTSSGMMVINPPWTLWASMEQCLPYLVEQLAPEQGFYRLEQLVAEN